MDWDDILFIMKYGSPDIHRERESMDLDWSEQSPHIRTLYRPWQPGDGYEEDVIEASEAQLGGRLPDPLRIFYQAWGQRKDMTQRNQALLGPTELLLRPDALMVCLENQGVYAWAIPHDSLADANPPVVRTQELEASQEWNWSEVDAPAHWMPSHPHLSNFLDSLMYQHAFCGGALHGGWGPCQPKELHETWLSHYWHCIMARPMALGAGDVGGNDPPDIPLYRRDGLLLYHSEGWCMVAARSVEDLDTIAQVLQIMWKHRW